MDDLWEELRAAAIEYVASQSEDIGTDSVVLRVDQAIERTKKALAALPVRKCDANVAHDRVREEARIAGMQEINDRCSRLERENRYLRQANRNLVLELDEVAEAIPEHLVSRSSTSLAQDVRDLVEGLK